MTKYERVVSDLNTKMGDPNFAEIAWLHAHEAINRLEHQICSFLNCNEENKKEKEKDLSLYARLYIERYLKNIGFKS
jgi:hypothetical protein